MSIFYWDAIPEGVNELYFKQPPPEEDMRLPEEVQGKFWLSLPFNPFSWRILLPQVEVALPEGFEDRYGPEPNRDSFGADRRAWKQAL